MQASDQEACFADMHEGDQEDAITDLIADLLHLAYRKGWNAEQLAERGVGHFQTEKGKR